MTGTVVVTVSVIVITKDATGGGLDRDVVLLIVTVGVVIVVGGKVSGVRLLQRLLKSEVPIDAVRQVTENKMKMRTLAFTQWFQYTD